MNSRIQWEKCFRVKHPMMTSSNGIIFRATGLLCGEFTGDRLIPFTKAGDAELWRFFDLRLNKRLSERWWGWWFETPSRSSWRHCNAFVPKPYTIFSLMYIIWGHELILLSIITPRYWFRSLLKFGFHLFGDGKPLVRARWNKFSHRSRIGGPLYLLIHSQTAK